MKRKEAAILLTPARLEFVVLDGRQGPQRGIVTALDPAGWESAWVGGLRSLDDALASSVKAMDAEGYSVSVFHAAPGTMVQVLSLPGRRGDAEQAAALALGEHFGRSIDSVPHAVSFLGQDTESEARLSHFIACAGTEEDADAVAEWAARAGLDAVRIVPVEAGTLASVANEALARGTGGVDVRLRIGEDGSALEASERGSIRILRPVDVDLGVLVGALTRTITRDVKHGGNVTLTHQEARTILFGVGLPDRDAVIDAARAIRGADILALLSPVLQRCVTQVRQTLRFGLDDDARAHARLRVEGPGSRVPGLAEMVATETGLTLDGVVETGAAFDAPGHPDGDLMVAVRSIPREINLVSSGVARGQRDRRMKMTLAAGVVLAFGAIGADAMLTEMAYRSTRDELSRVSASAEEAKLLLDLRSDLEQRRGALGAVMASAQKALGERVSWSAVLNEIATAAPREVRIMEINASRDGSGALLTMRAYLVSEDASTPNPDGVRVFLNALSASPLCESVAMGETQRSKLDDRGALQFSAAFRPRTLPMTAFVQARETP